MALMGALLVPVFSRVIEPNDLVPIGYLDVMQKASRSVGKVVVVTELGNWMGTGFLVAPGLLMTNNHVLPDKDSGRGSFVQMNYQKNVTPETFYLDPDAFFYTSQELDYTVVGVEPNSSLGPLSRFGYLRVNSEVVPKVNDHVTVIQHPHGRRKEIALRDNRVANILDYRVWYFADSEAGSSGSPMLDDQGHLVGIHHAGIPTLDANGDYVTRSGKPWVEGKSDPDDLVYAVNEGILMSFIRKDFQANNPKVQLP